jgi:hypothetical protein
MFAAICGVGPPATTLTALYACSTLVSAKIIQLATIHQYQEVVGKISLMVQRG